MKVNHEKELGFGLATLGLVYILNASNICTAPELRQYLECC